MKSVLSILVLLFIFSTQAFANEGVRKVKKATLKIDKVGKVTIESNEIITTGIKATKSKNKGKWKGVAGKIFGKFYPKGSDEIINVDENKIHKLNRKKKKCETRPLVTEESQEGQKSLKSVFSQMKAEQDKHKEMAEAEKNDNMEILAQGFTVEDLNQSVTHGKFACNKFLITFFQKTRDKETGAVRLDSASIKTDMTKMTDEIRKALEIELAFSKNYFEKLGMEFDFMNRNILGMDYLEKYQQANKGQDVSFGDHTNAARELEKLRGLYPMATQGAMYSMVSETGNKEKRTDSSDQNEDNDIKKKGFNMAKGLFGKKNDKPQPKGPVAFLEFSETVIDFALGDFTNELHPQFKCKEKK